MALAQIPLPVGLHIGLHKANRRPVHCVRAETVSLYFMGTLDAKPLSTRWSLPQSTILETHLQLYFRKRPLLQKLLDGRSGSASKTVRFLLQEQKITKVQVSTERKYFTNMLQRVKEFTLKLCVANGFGECSLLPTLFEVTV